MSSGLGKAAHPIMIVIDDSEGELTPPPRSLASKVTNRANVIDLLSSSEDEAPASRRSIMNAKPPSSLKHSPSQPPPVSAYHTLGGNSPYVLRGPLFSTNQTAVSPQVPSAEKSIVNSLQLASRTGSPAVSRQEVQPPRTSLTPEMELINSPGSKISQDISNLHPKVFLNSNNNDTTTSVLLGPKSANICDEEMAIVTEHDIPWQEDVDDDGDGDGDHEIPIGPRRQTRRGHTSPVGSSQSSIGTCSPLVPRYEQPDRGKARKRFTEKIADTFRRFSQEMRDDHALFVRYTLVEPKPSLVADSFVDEDSPFAHMKPLKPIDPKDTTEDEFKVTLSSVMNVNKPRLKKRTLVAKQIISDVPQVPIYTAHTNVTRNILCENEDMFRYDPYLGDYDTKQARLKAELKQAYGQPTPPVSGRQKERQYQIRSYIDRWLEEMDPDIHFNDDRETLERYCLMVDHENIKMDRGDINALLEHVSAPARENRLWDQCEGLFQMFGEVFGQSLTEVLLHPERVRDLAAEAKLIRRGSPKRISEPQDQDMNSRLYLSTSDRIGTYTNLSCLICSTIGCITHGDYEYHSPLLSGADDGDMITKQNLKDECFHQQLVLPFGETVRKHDLRLSVSREKSGEKVIHSTKNPCSKDCHYIDAARPSYEMTAGQLSVLESMLITTGRHPDGPCHMSFGLGLPCWQVYNEASKFPSRKVKISQFHQEKPHWYNNEKKILEKDWQESTEANIHQVRGQTNPCSHDGPCGPNVDCSCFSTNIVCENFCGCAENCSRRWTGCSCKAVGKNCETDKCICIQMNRECGPECGSCGAVPRINPANKYKDELFKTGCQNVFLQRGASRKIVIGESQLVGFGAYAAEFIRKDESFAEYAGETISCKEAERRGIIYDQKTLSFLFDLNKDWVIDAARLGTKTRFINHADSERDGLNCQAKVVLVNGEHRIKFFALRDIKPGEELLFDYGRKFVEKHGLSKKLPKAKGKRGVVEGRENIEALNGLNPANRAKRREITAAGGGRGRKARKTAPEPPNLEHESPELDVEVGDAFNSFVMEDHENEDEHDVENMDEDFEVRRKRRIVKPSKYTH